MSNELALAIDFYMWLTVCVICGLALSALLTENFRLRRQVRILKQRLEAQS